MSRIRAAGGTKFGNENVDIVPVDLRVVNVICRYLPVFIPSESLCGALRPHGRLLKVSYFLYNGRLTVRNGDRVVKIEMSVKNPVPNSLRVLGDLRLRWHEKSLPSVLKRGPFQGNIATAATLSSIQHRPVKDRVRGWAPVAPPLTAGGAEPFLGAAATDFPSLECTPPIRQSLLTIVFPYC